MKRKAVLLITINLLLLTNNYAVDKQDSIYNDLYTFLIQKGSMPQGMDWVLECDTCKQQHLYLFNILKDDFPDIPDFINIPFGIYKFQYDGCMDCGFYVLIKYNDNYAVYYQNEVTLIIKNLIEIKKNNPDLIDSKLFEDYIEAITDDRLGVNNERLIYYHTIGRIKYYR